MLISGFSLSSCLRINVRRLWLVLRTREIVMTRRDYFLLRWHIFLLTPAEEYVFVLPCQRGAAVRLLVAVSDDDDM